LRYPPSRAQAAAAIYLEAEKWIPAFAGMTPKIKSGWRVDDVVIAGRVPAIQSGT